VQILGVFLNYFNNENMISINPLYLKYQILNIFYLPLSKDSVEMANKKKPESAILRSAKHQYNEYISFKFKFNSFH